MSGEAMLGGPGGLDFRARVPCAGFRLRTPKASLVLLRSVVFPGFAGTLIWLMLLALRALTPPVPPLRPVVGL